MVELKLDKKIRGYPRRFWSISKNKISLPFFQVCAYALTISFLCSEITNNDTYFLVDFTPNSPLEISYSGIIGYSLDGITYQGTDNPKTSLH